MSEARFARVVPYVETASVVLFVSDVDMQPALAEVAALAVHAHEWATLRQETVAWRITLDGPTDATPAARLAAVKAVERAARKALESRGFVVIGRLM